MIVLSYHVPVREEVARMQEKRLRLFEYGNQWLFLWEVTGVEMEMVV